MTSILVSGFIGLVLGAVGGWIAKGKYGTQVAAAESTAKQAASTLKKDL